LIKWAWVVAALAAGHGPHALAEPDFIIFVFVDLNLSMDDLNG
jgi:hypothetical protein